LEILGNYEVLVMRISCRPGTAIERLASRTGLVRLTKDETGTTAIEFAMVAAPFFMFIFAIVGVSFYFFINTSLDKGMDQASRLVRTGQAQNAKMTVKDFKDKICSSAGGWIKCNKVQVFVQKYPDWASVQPQACVDANGNVVANSAPDGALISQYSGSSSDIVMVTTCYKWEFPASIPYFKLGNMSDKSLMLQSSTAFRSEPFTPAS
jgi:Flp pilus assembly protein TadG